MNPDPQLKYLESKGYSINWKEKYKPDSAVFKYFLNNLKKESLKYWIPFRFAGKYYLMTFNNCYRVELVK